ncbi:MAG: hypothetical protein R2810_06445 [Flavobacteriales bacterium]
MPCQSILAFGIFFLPVEPDLQALGAGWMQTTFPVVERDDINVELEMVESRHP